MTSLLVESLPWSLVTVGDPGGDVNPGPWCQVSPGHDTRAASHPGVRSQEKKNFSLSQFLHRENNLRLLLSLTIDLPS